MSLKEELNKLKPLIGTDSNKFDRQLKIVCDLCKTEEDCNALDEFIRSGLNELATDLHHFNSVLLRRMNKQTAVWQE
jgi:hypothetical protein